MIIMSKQLMIEIIPETLK
nr:unnamed protein product [Callosobruchus chinensis]